MEKKLLLLSICIMTIWSCKPEAEIPSVSLNSERVDMDFLGGSSSSTIITSNYEWTAACPESWVVLNNVSGPAGTTSLSFSVKENTSIEPRYARVTISCSTAAKYLTIAQAEKDYISADKNIVEVDPEGGVVEVPLKSNTDFTVSIPESSLWLTTYTTKTLQSVKSYLKAEANPTFYSRDAEVSFMNRNVALASVTVSQAGKEGDLNIKVEHRSDNFTTPAIVPSNALGIVLWGDGRKADLKSGESYKYDKPGMYTVEIKSIDVKSVEFPNMCNIESITITNK